VAWRAQLMGWHPVSALCARLSRAQGAARQPPRAAARHQHALLKNRYLMRIEEYLGDLYWRNWLSITSPRYSGRMCCLLWEHTSFQAFWFLLRNWGRFRAKREAIQRRAGSR